MNQSRKRWVMLFSIPIFLLCINQLYATSLKGPLAVEIIDIRVVGEPIVGNHVTLEVDYKVNSDGDVQLMFNFPKAVIPEDGAKRYETKLKCQKGGIYTERIIVKVTNDGASLVNIIAQMENAPDSIQKQTSRHISIEHGKKDYAVFSSITNDFVKKSKSYKEHKKIIAVKGNYDSLNIDSTNVAPTLKSVTATSTYLINIIGTVTYDDAHESPVRKEGLYGGKIYFYFRNSSTLKTYHPWQGSYKNIHYDNINTNGSFYFGFGMPADLTGYDQIILLVGSGNPYVSYSLPDGYVMSTDQGDLTTFGDSEGAVLYFNPSNTLVSYSGVDIVVNSQDGSLLRNMMFAGELVKQRYNGSIPFSMPTVELVKSASPYHGIFSVDRKWNISPWGYVYFTKITIDPDYTNLETTSHEYGHYVNYRMWNGNYDSWDEDNSSCAVQEGWAIFYSFAARNYANKVYGDGIMKDRSNTEEGPFLTNPYGNNSFNYEPAIAKFSSLLWNLYDGYSDGIFKSSIYTGDNDDLSGYGTRVFEIMRSMANVKYESGPTFNRFDQNYSVYTDRFKSGLDAQIQNSIQIAYDFLIPNNKRMLPPQLKSATGTIQSSNLNNLTINWHNNIYTGDIRYSNRELGYHLYQRASDADSWTLVSTIPFTNGNYTWSNSNAYAYDYKISSYNTSGDSYGDVLLNLTCDNITNINYRTYSSNTTVSGCSLNISYITINNNASVIFDGSVNTIINGPFEVTLGSSVEIK
ncbi:MAG: hypothetical protein WCX31_05350 [Salinivirgaceae bacterium]